MPKLNPKHRKKKTEPKPLGAKKKAVKDDRCFVEKCSSPATHHFSITNLDGYLTKLGWTLIKTEKKTKRVGLCKKHYKDYKKLKDKDEKYKRYRDFGDKKMPKRDKAHYFLE